MPIPIRWYKYLKGISYIDENRQDLHLLFNLSSGSTLEPFLNQLVNEYEKSSNHGLKKPSKFFLRSMGHFHIAILKQVLSENLPMKALLEISEEWVTFIWHGGVGLISQVEKNVSRNKNK